MEAHETATRNLDHFYLFGDVYETLDTCAQLETLLGRLRRQRLMSDEHWMASKDNVAAIRGRIQQRLDEANLTP